MCYSAYTKGTAALLGAILAAAEELHVREDLYRQWNEDDPKFSEQAERRVRRSASKAWRFAGEMDEVAATFREAGQPGDFHAAAALVYRRLAKFRGSPAMPSIEDLIAALGEGEEATPSKDAQ